MMRSGRSQAQYQGGSKSLSVCAGGPEGIVGAAAARPPAERCVPAEWKERVVRRGFFGTVLLIVWLVVGVIIAQTHHYLRHLGNIKAIGSLVLAILLWPLVLLGVNLHLK
jgi:hypothetical protein